MLGRCPCVAFASRGYEAAVTGREAVGRREGLSSATPRGAKWSPAAPTGAAAGASATTDFPRKCKGPRKKYKRELRGEETRRRPNTCAFQTRAESPAAETARQRRPDGRTERAPRPRAASLSVTRGPRDWPSSAVTPQPRPPAPGLSPGVCDGRPQPLAEPALEPGVPRRNGMRTCASACGGSGAEAHVRVGGRA